MKSSKDCEIKERTPIFKAEWTNSILNNIQPNLIDDYTTIMSILDDSKSYGIPRSSADIELGDFVLCDYGGVKFGVVVAIPGVGSPYRISQTKDMFESDIFTVVQIYDLKTIWNGIQTFSFNTHGSMPIERRFVKQVGNNALFTYFSNLRRKKFDASWETVDFLNCCMAARKHITNWRSMELQNDPANIVDVIKRKVVSKTTYELRFIDNNGMYEVEIGYGMAPSDITYGIGLGGKYIATMTHRSDSPYQIKTLMICRISADDDIGDDTKYIIQLKDISISAGIQFLIEYQKGLKMKQEHIFQL